MTVEFVNTPWMNRIAALLLGRKIKIESHGVRLLASYWMGVYYILYVKLEAI